MMPKILQCLPLAFLGALIALPAAAQQANVVTACGSMAPLGALTAGGTSFPTIDTTGKLCLGGGGTTFAAESEVQAEKTRLDEIDARLKKLEAKK